MATVDDIIRSIQLRESLGLDPCGSNCDRPTMDNNPAREDRLNPSSTRRNRFPPRERQPGEPFADMSTFIDFSYVPTREVLTYQPGPGEPLIPDNYERENSAERMRLHGGG